MIIDITGRHVTVTEDLKQHALERLQRVLRHHPEVVSAHVILDAEKTRRTVEMVVHGRSLTAAVHADSTDHHVSIDRAAEKMRHYLEHHLTKHKDRKRHGRDREVGTAATRELAALQAFVEAQALATAKPTAKPGKAGKAAVAAKAPVVARTRSGKAKDLTLADAARAFESGGRDILLFRDVEREALAVLYRRSDGKLAVLEVGEA